MRFSPSAPPSGGTRNPRQTLSAQPIAAADAIIVLGCKLRPDGLPSGRLRRRVALGVQLFESGVAPLILMAGAGLRKTEGQQVEAQAMRELAIAAGVPESALLLEPWSRNTAENALCSARVLHCRGLRRIVVVSDRAHLFRASLLFRLAGFAVVGRAGTPSCSTVGALASRFREAAALPGSVLRVLRRRPRDRGA